MDKLSELQIEAKEDLIILDDEDLHQQSYKNQIIKPKWLDYKSSTVCSCFKRRHNTRGCIVRSGNTMVVKLMRRFMPLSHLI